MARNVQLVEIDLRAGIYSNESSLKIGARLTASQNAVWGYPYPRSLSGPLLGPWFVRQPLTFPSRATVLYSGSTSFRDIAFTANGALATDGVLLIGQNASDQYHVWDTAGANVPFAGGVTRFTIPTIAGSSSRFLGCSAKWQNPGKDPNGGADTSDGVTVFSHYFGTHVYYLLDSASSIRSLTTDVSGCPAGAGALAVHLDRLWLLKSGLLYYTDPLNLDSIRTTSVVRVLGDGRCLVPGQLGAIDNSGVPHLIIGCASSVQVLDGDPQLGGGLQADMRTLSVGVGMASPHVAAVTPYGVYFLGTDGSLWNIPNGAPAMTRVSDPIRDKLGFNVVANANDQDGSATGSVVWFDPYLYIYPGGNTHACYLAEPSAEGIKAFWGPMTLDQDTGTREAVVRSPYDTFSTHAPSGAHVPSVHSIDVSPSSSYARYLAFDTRTAQTGSYPSGSSVDRICAITTGMLNVPGHRIQVKKVLLEVSAPPVTSAGTTVEWTVSVTGETGSSVTATLALATPSPAAGVYDGNKPRLLHFQVPDLPGKYYARVTIRATTEADLCLHRAFVEIHTDPATP